MWGSEAGCPPPHPQDPPSYLQHHGAELPLAVELPCASQDGGGLPGAGGAIEQEVGQPVLTDEPLDWEEGGTQGLGEGTGAWGTWGLMGLTGDWRTQGHGWEYGALGREGGRLWGYRGMGGIGDRRVHSGLGGHRGLGGGNGEGKRKVIGAWEGAWGLGGHRFGGVTGDWGQEGLEGHGGVQGLGGGVEVGGGTVARRAEGHGGGGRGEVVGAWTWARGGARNWEGCRDSGSTAGRGHGRGHGDEGRSTRAGEGARDGEGARGAPSIPSAGSRHSLVLRMSRCDTNSDSARGRYFSTLRGTALSAGAAQPPPPPPAPRRPPGPGPAPRQVPPARPRHGPARARPRERGGSAGTAAKGRGLEGAERGNRGWERGNGVARRRWREREGAAALSSGLSCAVSSDLPARECHPVDAASIILTLGRSIPTPFSWSQRTGEWRRGGSSPFPPPCSTGPGGALCSQRCRESSRAELSNDKLHFI